MTRVRLAVAVFVAALLAVSVGFAAPVDPHAGHDHAPGAHGQATAAGTTAHGDAGHGAHGGEHHGLNWYYGLIAEKEGLDHPTLLFRPKGMPAPVLAMVINAAILFGLLYRFGAKPVTEALKARKERIMAGMDEAAKMKKDARSRLRQYEEKLERMDDEIQRVRDEMKVAMEQERKRALSEARERRERMERDAKLLIEQELKAAREALHNETVRGAMDNARKLLEQQVSSTDQTRLADEYLAGLKTAVVNSRGGQA